MSTNKKRATRRDHSGAKKAAPLTLGLDLPDAPTEPFLKWAGGKGQLLAELTRRLPHDWQGDFFEPFMGSAAFYFHLKSHGKIKGEAHLGDLNEALATCFKGVQDDPAGVIRLLKKHREAHLARGLTYYLEVRAKHNLKGIRAAARFIFLNRTCFNGLWRVNSKGHFNVPMGRYKDPLAAVMPRISPAARILNDRTSISCASFKKLTQSAAPGSLIYFDPPYDPLTKTAAFTAYTTKGFDEQAQIDLRNHAKALQERGCYVMLSNSSTRLTRELYGDKKIFHWEEVPVRRAISANGSTRGVVRELIITTYHAQAR